MLYIILHTSNFYSMYMTRATARVDYLVSIIIINIVITYYYLSIYD